MAQNGISTLATKELRQRAKLDLAATNRLAQGNPRSTYDITLLPTQYDGNDVINNPHPDGLLLGRPWLGATPITDGLILYYDPNNSSSYSGSGNTINSLASTNLAGSMSNVTFVDPYFSYNGTNSQVSIADNVLLEPGSGNWTMEVWVNQNASGNDVVLGKFDSGGAAQNVGYSIRTTGTSYYAQFSSGSGTGGGPTGTLFVNSTSYSGTINTWYQLVYVFKNGATKTLETFVNGSSIGSVNHNLTSILNTSANLYLGSYNGGEYAQWFDGKIGITRLYNAALTSTQVLQNYNSNRSIYGL